MKTRLLWLLAVLVVGFVHWAEAQQPKKMPVIGILESGSRDSSSERVEAFRQGLREFGYIERETIGIEYRYAEGSTDRFAAFAAELAQLKVDRHRYGLYTGRSGCQKRHQRDRYRVRFRLMIPLHPGSSPAWRGRVEILPA
jgi:hypothetical protein